MPLKEESLKIWELILHLDTCIYIKYLKTFMRFKSEYLHTINFQSG